ncbi:MAG: hypothetical protein PHH58_03215 [Rhodoferax sp.]|nr:hypothetical protein [Rhodoferax sp.]
MELDLFETDAQRMSASPARSFDFVFSDVLVPSDQTREALRTTWLKVVNMGHAAGVRALRAVWPAGASWPSGEDYLHTLGWRPDTDFDGDDEAADAYSDDYDGPELMDLLFWRLSHINLRLYRDAQVLRVIDPASPNKDNYFTHVVVQRYDFDGNAPCGTGEAILTIDEAIPLLRQHAHSHPACGCIFSPGWERR